jgi:hypothetical protein
VINKNLNLEVWPTDDEVGEYLAGYLTGAKGWPDVRLGEVPEIVALLQNGNDPFLVAVEQKRSFESVVALAENQLVATFGLPGKGADVKYLPTNVRDYLFYAAALEKKNQEDAQAELGFFGRAAQSVSKFFGAIKEGLTQ